MQTIKIQAGQSLLDIAIEHCGDAGAGLEIAQLNGVALTASLQPGTILVVPGVVNNRVVEHFKQRGLSPATFVSLPPAAIGICTIDLDFGIQPD